MLEDNPLVGQKILMFTGETYEDLELWYPKYRLTEAGATVEVAGEETGVKYNGKNGYPHVADLSVAEVAPESYQGLVVPGGFMPDRLRRNPKVLEIVRHFAENGKCLAAVCHGGWIPISAGVYQGIRVTGSPGIKDDLINTGAIWEDDEVVVDRNFVSSRKPDDLPAFCREIIRLMAKDKI